MTGLVGNISTTTEWQTIPFKKGSYKTELTIVMCETSGSNNTVSVLWRRGDAASYLYNNFSLQANNTYPAVGIPFKITLNLGDSIEVKSSIPGVDISLVS